LSKNGCGLLIAVVTRDFFLVLKSVQFGDLDNKEIKYQVKETLHNVNKCWNINKNRTNKK